MKRMSVLLLVLGGCGAVDYPATPADVLTQCNRGTLLYTAAEVTAIIATTVAFFEDGYTYDELRQNYFDGCQARWGFNSDDADGCTICFWAALDLID